MRTAVLFSGSPYTFRNSLPSLRQHLLEPNGADAFVMTTRENAHRRASSTFQGQGPAVLDVDANDQRWCDLVQRTYRVPAEVSDADLGAMRSALGPSLRTLRVAEDVPGYMDDLRRARVAVSRSARSYVRAGGRVDLPADDSLGFRALVDQYYHVRACYGLMVAEETAGGFVYDRVARARMDFIADEPLVLDACDDDRPRVAGCFRQPQDRVEFADEFFWYSSRAAAARIFPGLEKMGTITDRKYATVDEVSGHDHRFDPEMQWSLLLRELGFDEVAVVPIFRSARYTLGADGYYYINYLFHQQGRS